jgi:hypothetical protein
MGSTSRARSGRQQTARFSSLQPYSAGTKALELKSENGAPKVRELWTSSKFRVKHGNILRIGDTIYGGSGDSGPCPLTAVEAKTGKILWQDRQFATAKMVHLGDNTRSG